MMVQCQILSKKQQKFDTWSSINLDNERCSGNYLQEYSWIESYNPAKIWGVFTGIYQWIFKGLSEMHRGYNNENKEKEEGIKIKR